MGEYNTSAIRPIISPNSAPFFMPKSTPNDAVSAIMASGLMPLIFTRAKNTESR